jgi:competence protein ComEC
VFIKNLPTILKLLIPYLFGVIFQFYVGFLLPYLEISILLLFVLVLLNLPFIARQHFLIKTNGVLINLLFFLFGGFSVTSTNSLKNDNYFFEQGKHTYQLYVNEPVIEKDKSVKVFVDVISRNKCKTIGKSLVYIEKSPQALNLKYGDIILINGSFKPIKTNGNPEEFNYRDYLQKKQIYHQAYLKNNQWKKIENKANLIFKFTYSIRNYYAKLIDDSILKKHNKDVLKALLLGQKDDLDKETLRTFSSAGAMHVLAVSGLHVGIIMLMLMLILKPMKKFKHGKKVYVLLIVLCLWFYAFLTGLSPSVLRSALMFSFVVVGKEMERETSIYQSILVSAFILMIINPLVIFKVGFQLSYLAVLGIVYLQPKIYNLWYIKYKLLDYLWKITSVSIAAQIATFPLGLYYFHQFPNYFFISNLIVIPLAGGILGLGLGYLLFFKIPFVNDFILLLLDYFLSFLNYFVEKVEQLPYSILWGISITWYETIFIYIILLFVVFAFTLKKIKLLFTALFFTICLIGVFMINSYHYEHQNQLIVYNVKNEVALDVFYGKDNFFIASDSLYMNDEKMLFNIKHNWFKIRQTENPYQFISTNRIKKSIFKINKKTISIVDGNSNRYITDFVVIGKINSVEKSYLNALEKNQATLIITSKCSYKVKMFIENNYPKNLIYKLDEKGAFIFSF